MLLNNHPLITEYLEYGRTIKAYSVHTIEGYRSALNAFVAAHPDTDPADMTSPEIISYEHSRVRILRPRSRARDVCAIRAFYKWLHEEKGAIKRNPALKLKPPTLDDSTRSCPLAGVRQKLMDATLRLRTDYRCIKARAILGVMFYAGLRPGEVCTLELPDVILREEESIIIVQLGKRSKRREVPLSDDLVVWLKDWLRIRRSPNQRFFVHGPSCRPVSLYILRGILAEVKAAAGVKDKFLTPHSGRHSFATTLYEETKDLPVVQEVLGHKNIETTRGYVHVTDKRKFAAVQLLNRRPDEPEKKTIKPIRLMKRRGK